MRAILTIAFISAVLTCGAQTYEYVRFHQVKAGVNDNAKLEFVWPNRPDSATILTNMKMREPILAIQTMEKKGFELVTINEVGPGSLVTIVSVYMRRRRQ